MCSSLLKHSVWLISHSTGFHQLLKPNNKIALLKVLQELIFFQLHIMPYSKWSWVILQRTYGHQNTPADWTPPNLHQRTNLSHLSQMWDITVFLLTLFFFIRIELTCITTSWQKEKNRKIITILQKPFTIGKDKCISYVNI